MFRRNVIVDEPATKADVARAFRPVLIHIGMKLTAMWLIRRAIRHNLEQRNIKAPS